MNRDHPPLSLPGSADFLWAVGIEDTFIAEPNHITGRTLDEYDLTDHYERWPEDLALAAELDVPAIRYGIPWYRVCPDKPGQYDWSWSDRALETIVQKHRMEPIVDLVHYGTPGWLDEAFLNPDYPKYVADYAHAFAEHYRGLCYWYSPCNEPRVTAWYTGRIGWWPPNTHSWQGFAQVLMQLSRGICLTQQAIETVEPKASFVHVDATDLYKPADASDDELVREAGKRQAIVFLALDLVQGRVGADHPLYGWLLKEGCTGANLEWFGQRAVRPHIIGYNMYPMFSYKRVERTASGNIRVRIVPCWTETLAELTRLYADRYAPTPVMVTETACNGAIGRRLRWIDESVEVVRSARQEGRNVVGYTFWPLFSLVGWAYQRSEAPLAKFLIDMGLWDLRPGPNGLERVRTPAVDAFQRVAHAPMPPVGGG